MLTKKIIDWKALGLLLPVLEDRIDELKEWSHDNNDLIQNQIADLEKTLEKLEEFLYDQN